MVGHLSTEGHVLVGTPLTVVGVPARAGTPNEGLGVEHGERVVGSVAVVLPGVSGGRQLHGHRFRDAVLGSKDSEWPVK